MDDKRLDLPQRLLMPIKPLKTLKPEDFNNSETVKYNSISLSFLLEFYNDILTEKRAQGVDLYELIMPVKDFPVGMTGQIVPSPLSFASNSVALKTPYLPEPFRVEPYQIRRKLRQLWSTDDVVNFCLLPWATPTETCIVDLVDKKFVGQPFQGAFVSQARKCVFSELVNALQRHFKQQAHLKNERYDPEHSFCWLDLISANQPQLCSLHPDPKVMQERYNLLQNGLHEAIKHFDERLIFFNSFENPAPISRAWCVWELYGIAKNNLSLDVICSENSSIEMTKLLKIGRLNILNLLSSLDLEAMSCYSPKDLEMIRNAVLSLPEGFSQVKQTVTKTLRIWLVKFANNLRLSRLRALRNSGAGELSEQYTIDDADLLFRLGELICDLGEYDLSLIYCNVALDLYKKFNTEDRFGAVWEKLGYVYYVKGDFNSALNFYSQTLSAAEKLKGQSYQYDNYSAAYQVANSYFNLSNVYLNLKELDKAQSFGEKSLKEFILLTGEISFEVARSNGTLSQIYKQLMKENEAIVCSKRAIDIVSKILGLNHPSLANEYFNLGQIYVEINQKENALDMLFKVLKIRLEIFGEGHEKVAETFELIGRGFGLDKMTFDESLNYFTKAIKIYQSLRLTAKVAKCFLNMGITRKFNEKYIEAVDNISFASRLFETVLSENIENKQHVGDCFWEIAHIYLRTEEYNKSIEYYQKTFDIYDKLPNRRYEIAIISLGKGLSYEKQGYFHEAVQNYLFGVTELTRVRNYSNQDKVDTQLEYIYSGLVRVFKAVGDSGQESFWQLQLDNLNRQIINY